MSCSTHKTFKDYNDQKSCYRFLSNEKVTEEILISKLQNMCKESVSGKSVLALVDTSTITLDRYKGRVTNFEGLGTIGRNQHSSSCVFFLHPIYVIDAYNGRPYGLAGVHIFNRKMETNPPSKDEKRYIKNNSPIESKESFRWVGPCEEAKEKVLQDADNVTFVMDREADIWDVFQRLPGGNCDVVIRSKENRRIINSKGENTRLYTELSQTPVLGQYKIKLPKNKVRKTREIKVELKSGTCKIRPNQFNNCTTALEMNFVEVKEVRKKGQKETDIVHWILWTNKKVSTKKEAKEIIKIYAKRWDIEVYFKLLKSDGFDIENCQLGTGKSIRRLTLIIMDAAIRVLQLKSAREGKTKLKIVDVFEPTEIECLKLLNEKLNGNTERQKNPYPEDHLAWASWVIARLAGWKGFYEKKNLPGNKTFVLGLEKFDVLVLGYSLSN